MRNLFTVSCICLSTTAIASDFNLPFVNSSGLGVAYADWASAASDASTAYTNPAGLVMLRKKQMVLNLLGITGNSKFNGTATTPPFPFSAPVIQSGEAQSPINAFVPAFYFAAPVSDRLSFGFNVAPTFGLGTKYSTNSIVRYAATRSEVKVLDIGPSFGFKVSEALAIGAGLDANYLEFKLNNMYGPPLSFPGDSHLQNRLNGWGVGWHAGALLNLTPQTRIGASFNSQIHFNTLGTSEVTTPAGAYFYTNTQQTNATLPDRTQLSVQQDLTDKLVAMFTVFYTNWQTFDKIVMQRTQTPFGFTVPVNLPFNYHNTFDYAVGSAFQVTDQWKVRAGILFLGTPSNDIDRQVADPIGSATVLTVGARYQPCQDLWFDVGLGHSFFKQMPINYINPITALSGHTNTQTTAFGGQINWQIA